MPLVCKMVTFLNGLWAANIAAFGRKERDTHDKNNPGLSEIIMEINDLRRDKTESRK
jgi:hypothetical protein